MFSQVLNELRMNHPDSLDPHALIMAAIQGMLHAADPHSFAIARVHVDPFRERLYAAGKLWPIPITFALIDDAMVVVSVTPGSDAARQNILPGDQLVTVNGKTITADSPEELQVSLADSGATPLDMVFRRRRNDGTLVDLTRRVVHERATGEHAVVAATMLDPHTGYIRITNFVDDKAADEFHDAIGQLSHGEFDRLVLDLRGNGGGRIDLAARVAGEFLPKGDIVYTAEGRKRDITDTSRVSRSFWKHERRFPLVVLIDAGTASAAELVAGALQDHDRAIIVGRPSFGKALLLKPFALTDGSMLMMVVGRVHTPCGRVIQREYRGVRRSEYFFLASRAARDTAGRPFCKTDAGRTVYGGGGIIPDIEFPPPRPTPVWLERVEEDNLPLRWIGGFLDQHAGDFLTANALAASPSLAPNALADFRAFAAGEGDTVPQGPDADHVLQELLVLSVAQAKWGAAAYYRVAVAFDTDIARSMQAFDQTALLAGVSHGGH